MMIQSERMLKILLRVGGAISLLAVVAVVMPRRWMETCHEWLGLGAFPDGAIVEYLARSVSAWYAIFGGLLLLSARDVRRYAGVITYLAATHVAFAAAILVIDLRAGLPWQWTAAEVSTAAGFGVALLALQARIKSQP